MAEAVLPIRFSDYVAEIATVGAGLCKLERSLAGTRWALTETWPADAPAPLSAGLVLAPWPNRVRHGRFRFGGVEHQLDITEPARDNAIHGLVRRREWTVVEHAEQRAALSIEVGSEPGWPYPLRLTMAYEVGPNGLTVTNTVVNIGEVPAPYGFGMHAFVRAGDTPVDECTLQLPASVWLPLDPDAMTPAAGVRPAAGDHDFAAARALAGLRLDTPFSGLVADLDGKARAVLRPPVGPATVLWVEPRLRWLQVFTADPADKPYPGRGRALAVEPMTCPPDALNSGIDLLILEPGEQFAVSWGMLCV
jgi:aldose 1-epimerase